ncbi:hypothetical protein M132_3920 [Bacteroides fragilis str. S24L15]|nr:hypothetical protein M132_3920 [Bacteroides fragilis str. S24L15]EYA73816.1 hypothetical protein M133_4122 [Bacteroides fragilis str. S24L26]
MLNQVIGREETRRGKGLKMKTIEKRGSICQKKDKCRTERDSCD